MNGVKVTIKELKRHFYLIKIKVWENKYPWPLCGMITAYSWKVVHPNGNSFSFNVDQSTAAPIVLSVA